MTANPIDLIGGLTTTSNVPKADVSAWAKARVPQVIASVTEIRNTILAGQLVITLKTTGQVLFLDSTDTTTADDGINCIISSDGFRFKPLSPVPLPTPTSLGGVFSHAAVSHFFVTGINTDGSLFAAQPALTDISSGTSAQLAAVVSDETGSGSLVFANAPTLVTPVLGVASATSINKVALTAPATSATLTIPDGVTLTGPASSGTAMTLGNAETVTGIKTFGSTGAVGRFKLAGTTSGTTILDASATASGTLTLPAATDTLIGKATTDVLTNKTFDSAGTGNVLKINGTGITAVTGTGSAVLATSPTLVTPLLGTPTSGVLTNCTGFPLAGLVSQAAFTFVGNNTSGSAAPTAVDISTLTLKASPASTDLIMISDQAASGAWKKVAVSSIASAGSVSSIAGNTGAFTLGVGLTNATNDIRISLSTATNSLGSDTAISNSVYTDGPSMAQGTSGTWLSTSTVTLFDTAGATQFSCKLWDGTTIISSAKVTMYTANLPATVTLSGVISSPAANIRVSVTSNAVGATSTFKFNGSGNSKDCTITGVRIA